MGNSHRNSDGNRFLKKTEVAEWLQVTARTIDEYMRKGLLPYYKIARTVRFKECDVEAVLREKCLVRGNALNN